MNGMLKWLLDSGLVQTQVKKAIAWAGTALAGAAVALIVNVLQKHGFVISPDMMADIQTFGTAIAAAVVGILTLLWSLRDAKHVEVALKASAATGEVVKPAQAKALMNGDAVALPSGQTITIGQITPKTITEEQATAALNASQLPKA